MKAMINGIEALDIIETLEELDIGKTVTEQGMSITLEKSNIVDVFDLTIESDGDELFHNGSIEKIRKYLDTKCVVFSDGELLTPSEFNKRHKNI